MKKISKFFYRTYLKFWKELATRKYFKTLKEVRDWARWNEIDKFFDQLSTDPYYKNFRRNKLVIQTMDYQGLESAKYSKTLELIGIKEPNFGRPLKPPFMKNSLNLGHQYKHIRHWLENSGTELHSINRIVEFGGGYGCMRWLLSQVGFKKSYVIVDNEGIKKLQTRYLKESLSEEFFNQTIWKNSLNMLSPKLNSKDLFIALWSISEIPDEMLQLWINEVESSNSHLLIAYQHTFKGRDNSSFFQTKFAKATEKPVDGLSGDSTSTYIIQ